jgi:phosphatidylserine/phosphatidylglycerophosphate/cardiolipin synthase-like enzyme
VRRDLPRIRNEVDAVPGEALTQRVLRAVDLELLIHADHYPAVVERVLRAQRSVWIATANLKELMIEDAAPMPGRRRGKARFRSVLSAFSELAGRGVELRILHAAPPSRVFVRDFDRQKRLVAGGLELRLCPRNHLKLVIVDGRHLYLGSANWTGAGLGAKNGERRNFELGLLTQDERLLDAAQDVFHRVWRGAECAGCRMRAECPMPLAEIERSGGPLKPAAALVRLRP